jgi:hypothetical protein
MASWGGIQLSPYTSALANNVTTKQPSLSSHETRTAKYLGIFHVPCFPHTEKDILGSHILCWKVCSIYDKICRWNWIWSASQQDKSVSLYLLIDLHSTRVHYITAIFWNAWVLQVQCYTSCMFNPGNPEDIFTHSYKIAPCRFIGGDILL